MTRPAGEREAGPDAFRHCRVNGRIQLRHARAIKCDGLATEISLAGAARRDIPVSSFVFPVRRLSRLQPQTATPPDSGILVLHLRITPAKGYKKFNSRGILVRMSQDGFLLARRRLS